LRKKWNVADGLYNRPVILAGDVGGTKTLLGLFRQVGGKLRCVREDSLPSQEFRSFEALVGEFLSGTKGKVDRCAVGVAGPVVAGRSHVVNLRWPVDARRLARKLSTNAVGVINDLEATGWGIPLVPPRKLASLTPGLRSLPGNAALIAAGTGLGMALLLWDGERWHPRASEGGHQAFGPRDDVEIDLLKFLRRRHGRVSVERAVSGPGLAAIYEFLIQAGRDKRSKRVGRRFAEADDPNAEIARAALAGDDAVAGKALDLFVSLYGAAAGDLALVAKATGGLYLGGGIAPKILPKLREGAFLDAFRDKGRLSPLLERIPVRVILEPRAALLGAARYAATRTSTTRIDKTKGR
jgi:glucokinase